MAAVVPRGAAVAISVPLLRMVPGQFGLGWKCHWPCGIAMKLIRIRATPCIGGLAHCGLTQWRKRDRVGEDEAGWVKQSDEGQGSSSKGVDLETMLAAKF